MDDLLYGTDTVEEATLQISQIMSALLAGQFPLTQWMTNNNEVLKDIEEKDRIFSYYESSIISRKTTLS